MDNLHRQLDWEPKDGHIMTRWAKDVSPENVLSEYPRPQMIRTKWINLNGLWDYCILPKEQEKTDGYDGKILVPYPIESALSGVERMLKPSEKLKYRKNFILPESWDTQKLLLHFGAVDWETSVYVNGIKVGEHTGGYYPFEFEISQFTHTGENEIVVVVWDPTDIYGNERGKQSQNPAGIFYTQVSGIWQTVWLEPVPNTYIQSFKVTPDIDNETVRIEPIIDGEVKDIVIKASVFENNTVISNVHGDTNSQFILKIDSPKLWEPDSPFLYGIKIEITCLGTIIDEITGYFGMRKFSTQKDHNGCTKVLLNNKPIFLSGLLDQGYWPDGLYTAPTDQALLYDIETAKKMGFNMLRKHIKVEPARWYYYCDLLGMIVWQDMPNGGGSYSIFHNALVPLCGINVKDNTKHSYTISGRKDPKNRDNFMKELKEMIDALYNIPSIMTWVPFNECWGQFNSSDTASWIKKYDPTRLVDHASGWHDQHAGDFKSIHTYVKKLRIPNKSDDRAIVISEYGGYGLPERGHAWIENKKIFYKGFKTKEELTQAYKFLLLNQVAPLVSKGLCAVIYTQLTDVETEINGLLTYDREIIKIDINLLHDINMKLYEQQK